MNHYCKEHAHAIIGCPFNLIWRPSLIFFLWSLEHPAGLSSSLTAENENEHVTDGQWGAMALKTTNTND